MPLKIPPVSPLSAFLFSLLISIFAEIGCLIRTAVVESKYGHPVLVFLGTMSGVILTTMLGIYIGEHLQNYLSGYTLRIVSGAFFILFGLLVILGKV